MTWSSSQGRLSGQAGSAKTQSPNTDGLELLFRPASVAVLGASIDPSKIGGRPVRYLKEAGFRGSLYPVNPKYKEVQGLTAYPSVGAIEEPIELAIIALPAHAVVEAVRACSAKGVRAALIFSAGFAEIGDEGRRMQEEIASIARSSGIRILGPNCLGVMNPRNGVIATFSAGIESGNPSEGRIGFVSQSGAFGSHCFAAAREKGLGFSSWVTTGNESDVEFSDCLAYLALDEDTEVIAAYLEGCRDGDKLKRSLEIAHENRKPVVILKVGASEIGAEAAASHTAALVGSDEVYDALFRQYNAHRVRSVSELLDVAYACTAGIFPTKGKIGLITVSGGIGIVMADAASTAGLDVAALPEPAQEKLRRLWAPAAVRNPVDTTAQPLNDPALTSKFLEIMLQEGGYDLSINFLTHVGLSKPLADRFHALLAPVRKKFPECVAVVSMLASPEVRKVFEDDGFLVFEEPTAAIAASAALIKIGRGFTRASKAAPPQPSPSAKPIPDYPLNERESKLLLSEADIRVVEDRLTQSAEEAAEAAEELGFPVALKVASSDVWHKSDAGGVVLGLDSAPAVRKSFPRLLERVRVSAPEAHVEGVLVTPMVEGGMETILGVRDDPLFGPTVVFGLGGVFVEVLSDVAFRIAPFGEQEAHAMIREIRGHPLLEGARGRKRADIAALARSLARLSVFAAENAGKFDSIDINPFIVLPEGQGAVAADALIVPKADSRSIRENL